jgi:hypothetical protein
MPLLQTVAFLEKNQSSALFPVELPLELGRREAKLTHLTACAGGNLEVGLSLAREVGLENVRSYDMQDIYSSATPVTVTRLYDRIKSHQARVKLFFKPLEQVPRVSYDKKNFSVVLPPGSALFTTDPLFFPRALLLPEERKERVSLPGESPQQLTEVFGFFNPGSEQKVWSGEQLPPGSQISTELPEDVTVPPTTTTVYVACYDTVATFFSAREELVTIEKVAEALQELLESCLVFLDFPADAASVNLDREGRVVISSGQVPESRFSLVLSLRGSVRDYLSGKDPVRFRLSEENSETFVTASHDDDPFVNSYPLTLSAPGLVTEASYLCGRGKDVALAFVRDSSVVDYSAKLFLGRRNMKVIFYDKHFEPVSLDRRITIFLTFEIQP